MTYADLRRSVQTWTSNTDPEFLSQLDVFIRQAEARIGMLVRLPSYSATASLVTVTGVNTITLATLTPQFISADYINLLDFGTLEGKEKSFMFEAFPNSGEQGPPRYFGLQDDLTVILGPTPDAVYNLTLYYFSKWPSLVTLGHNPATINNETFISRAFESALLQGTLMNAAMFMQNAEAYQGHKAEFMDALGLVKEYKQSSAKKEFSEKTNAANSGMVDSK
jgi:hypothetical protein